MFSEKELQKHKNQTYISRESLIQLIRRDKPDYKDASLRWVLYDLVQKGAITKVDPEYFRIGRVKSYTPNPGRGIKTQIEQTLATEFPAIKAVVYESTILNEWLNHQIARNVVFVEVEKYSMSPIFRTLQENLQTTILLKPSIDDYYLYGSDATIIVSNLITQAPVHRDSYDIRIEKLIVDIVANDLLREFVGDDEIEDMIDEIFSAYVVNIKTILAYAKRRRLEGEMRRVIQDWMPKKDTK